MAAFRNIAKNVYDLLRRRESAIQVQDGAQRPDESDDPTLSQTPVHTLQDHTHWILSIAFLPDGEHLISGSQDGTVRKWRVADGCGVGKVMNHGRPVSAVAVSGDGKVIASGGGHGRVIFWSVDTCETMLQSQEKHSNWITSLSFAQDSQKVPVASGSHDGSIVVWSALTGERIAGPFKNSMGWVVSLAYSPSGDKIASCDRFGRVRVWDVLLGKEIGPQIEVSDSPMRSVVWSHDKLVCGGYYGTTKFYNPADGALLATCEGHIGAIWSIAASQDGTFVASASWDGAVRLWSTSTHQQLASLAHPCGMSAVSLSPNSRYLASGGHDSKVYIWRLPDVDPIFQGGKEEQTASGTGTSNSQVKSTSVDNSDCIDSVERPTTAGGVADVDKIKGSGADDMDHTNAIAPRDSWLDMPAISPPRLPADGGVHSQFFGDDPPTPCSDSDVQPGKWKAKAQASRQYFSQQFQHFKDRMLPHHGPQDGNGASPSSSLQKLKDRIHRTRQRTRLAPQNTNLAQSQDKGSDEQMNNHEIKSHKPKLSLMSANRLRSTLVVASRDPPVQQEKQYFLKRDGKLIAIPGPRVQAGTQGPRPTARPSAVASSVVASHGAQGEGHGQQVSNDDDIELCRCCGFFIGMGNSTSSRRY